MRRGILLGWFLAIVWSGWVGTARAQTPEPSAVELAEKARRAKELGRLDDAIEAYASAYQVSGEAIYLFNMAETHREAGHLEDALRMFQTYVRRDPNGANRTNAERQGRELERLIEKAKKSGGSGAPGAAGADAAGKVAPKPTGPVRAPAPASPPPAKAITAPAAPASPPPPPAKAITAPAAPASPPAAKAITAPAAPASPPAANAIVPAPSPAPAPGAAAPRVSPAPPPPPPPSPSPPAAIPPATVAEPARVDLTVPGTPEPGSGSAAPPLPRWVPWALTAATVGLGVGAIVSGLSASNRYDELHDSCGRTAGGCATQDIDDVRSRARRANILWALTSAAAVGAGVTLYVNVNAAGASGVWSF